MDGAPGENVVSGIVTSHILDYVKLRQPEQDLWMNLSAQWSNAFPLRTRGTMEYPIAAPATDASIGYNAKKLPNTVNAKKHLQEICTPVKSEHQLVFPVVTIEAKGRQSKLEAQYQNQNDSAVMLRNLRTLREQAGMSAADLKTRFDNIAHVVTIIFTKSNMVISCCWSAMADDGVLEFFSKPVVIVDTDEGLKQFHTMTRNVQNPFDWATNACRDWIKKDLEKLESWRLGWLRWIPPHL